MKIWVATLVVDGYGADQYASATREGVHRKLAAELRDNLKAVATLDLSDDEAVIEAYCQENDDASLFVKEISVD